MAIRATADWRNASKSFQKELRAAGKTVSRSAEPLMLKGAEDFLRDAESRPKTLVPFYTGNLMDSIGVRLLRGSVLVGYRTMVETTTQHAMKPQRMKGIQGDIWGEVELMRRISRQSGRSRTGLAGQLIVGVPYADNVGGSYGGEDGSIFNADYFDELSDLFARKMETYVKLLEKYPNVKAAGNTHRMGTL